MKLPRLLAIVALAASYVVTARIGLALDAVAGFATLVWAPTGIALAVLLRGGRGLWPGVFAGAFIVNAWAGASPLVATGIAAGNTLEAVLGAVLLVRLRLDLRLERIADVAMLLAVALATTTVSATLGVASLLAGGFVKGAELGLTWRAWWVGDVIGDVIVAPLLLVWSLAPRPRLRWPRVAEGTLAVAVSVATCFAVFGPSAVGVHVLFAPLVWAAVRLGQRGCTLVVAAVSACAVVGTAWGHGPFAYAELSRGLLDLQSFMGFVAAVTMMLAAAIADRDHARAVAISALRGRDDFLAIASHELRTPLSALALQLGTMRRLLSMGEALSDERIDQAERQTDRLTHLLRSLFDVSRIAAGQLRLQPGPLDLEVLVRDVTDRMTDEAARAGSELRVRTTGPIVGSWDRVRLEQVLSNLLSNAFRYAPGRPVDVTLGGDSSGQSDRGGETARAERRSARLAVRDHGAGVPAASLEQLFTPYQRGNAARERGGLGLGLYISRHLVEAHGGTLTGRSEPGAGCEFVVELPLDPCYDEGDVRSAQGGGGLLLLVDDDDDFRGSLAEALELEGYLVAEVRNGAQALEWLRESERPSAVLLDLWMPTMDGWQLRLAMEERGYGDIAVVVMTAARTQDPEMLRVGQVLEKPFSMPELLAALRRTCSTPGTPTATAPH